MLKPQKHNEEEINLPLQLAGERRSSSGVPGTHVCTNIYTIYCLQAIIESDDLGLQKKNLSIQNTGLETEFFECRG